MNAQRQSVTGALVLDRLRAYKQEALAFLESLTLLESPSTEPHTQQPVAQRIVTELDTLAFRTRLIAGKSSGGMLLAIPRDRRHQQPLQLMLGHYDTVWPVGTLESMPYVQDDNLVKGPGTYDMKAGIMQAIFAIRTLQELELETRVTPVLFLNSDEEIGSGESTRHIRRLARCMNRVFVLEPSLGPSGHLKTSRKAVGRYQITVTGKAAHAGLDPEAGASAILELSHVIQKLFALNDPQQGVSVNVGTIDGGLRANVIAPQSQAIVDVRTRTQADAERVEASILALRAETPGTTLSVTGRIGRPALEQTPRNRKLWEQAKALAADLDLTIDQAQAGGGSDGNTTSQYTATLDGMGAVGDGAHAEHEHIDIDKTLERAALLAMLLLQPPT